MDECNAYKNQRKILKDAVTRFPAFARTVINFKKLANYTSFRDERIIIAGQPIADHVVLTSDVEGWLSLKGAN